MHAEMSEIAVINDNDNFAPCMFRPLWEIFGDCFCAPFFFFFFFFLSYAPSEKYNCPKYSPCFDAQVFLFGSYAQSEKYLDPK